jgi:hypothetical protein
MPSEEIDLDISLTEDSDNSGDDADDDRVDDDSDEEESDSSDEEEEDSEEESSEEDNESEDSDSKEKKKGKSKDSDEEDEEEEDEDEDKDKKNKNAGRQHSRPSFRDIKTAFPEFFKKFPDLRDAFFRERKYTEIFPTVDDAREAASIAASFGEISNSLIKGDPSVLLSNLAEANTEAFREVAKNLLPTIHSLDRETFFEITTPLFERFVQSMDREGARTGDVNLRKAALIVGKFMTGELKIPNSSSSRENPERIKFEEDKNRFFQQRHQQQLEDLHTTTRAEVEELIAESLEDIDGLTKWERRKLSEDILKKVDKSLAQDERHQALIRSMLKRWVNSNYSLAQKKQLTSAYLTRAKQLIEPTRDRILKDAKKKPVRKVVREDKQNRQEDTESRSSGSDALNPRKIDWSKTTDRDFLDDKVTLRK